ncbi:MAG TPA: POTRA domain-containing protein, partial [Rhodopila sp.]
MTVRPKPSGYFYAYSYDMRRLRNRMPTAVRWLAALSIGLTGIFMAGRLLAADPQPYTISLKPTGDDALDAALNGSSTLISLQKSAPVAGFALTERARKDVGRFETALHSFGYYKATIATTIAGHKLDDSALPAFIDSAPANPPLEVAVAFDLGPRFKLGTVTISTTVPPDIPAHLEIKSGDPAMAANVLAAQGRLLAALEADGYPLAKVPTPVAILHPDQNLLDVDFQPVAGPQANIGPIAIDGLKDMHEAFVQKRLLLHQGEKFNPETIEKARLDLSSIGVFSVVRAVPASALDANGQLPISFDLTERPLHAVDLGVAYSTDLGIDLTTAWHDRNLFGNAEQLNLTGSINLGGDAVTKPGYALG